MLHFVRVHSKDKEREENASFSRELFVRVHSKEKEREENASFSGNY